jgi:hypothetical protein
MTNTDQDAEALLQRGLYQTTWREGSLATGGFESREHWFAQFDRMSMPPILQGGLSL